MPGFGHWYDLIFVAAIALLIFGPKRLPEIGSSIGKTIKEFQRSMREVTSPNRDEASLPPAAPQADVQQLPSASAAVATEATPATPAVSSPVSAEPVKE